MKSASVAIMVVSGLLALASVAAAGDGARSAADSKLPEWVAPLQPPLRLTGTFGERRGDHLHSGVDFSTGGARGRPVRAMGGGSIVRMRAGAFGYGRALYLATHRGLLVVYGHLDRFAGPLEARLREAQAASGEYEVDFAIAAGALRVADGDTIAWSGATGSGPPHLHVELRRGDLPLNPLAAGLPVPDPAAPRIGPLIFNALGADGWVDDGVRAVRAEADTAAVRVYGPVGVEVVVVDANGTTDARLAPHALRLHLDGELCFARALEAFPFDRTGEVRRIYGRGVEGMEGTEDFTYRLYRWPPGARADVAEAETGETHAACTHGVIDAARLAPGRHRLCVEAVDAAGGRAEVCRTLEVAPPPRAASRDLSGGSAEPPAAARPAAASDSLPAPPGATRTGPAVSARVWFEEAFCACEILDGGRAEAPRVWFVAAEGGLTELTPRGNGPRGGWLFVVETGALAGLHTALRIELPQSGGVTTHALPALIGVTTASAARAETLRVGPLTLQSTPDTFPGAAILQVAVGAGGSPGAGADSAFFAGTAGELEPVSPLVRLAPEWVPFSAPLGLYLAEGVIDRAAVDTHEAWALYRCDDSDRWHREGRSESSAGWGALVTRPGRYALMVDRLAPRVARPQPADAAAVSARPETLRVVLTEEGAGVDPRRSDIALDGRALLAAYDVDAGELWAEVPAGLAPGAHAWTVCATDMSGRAERRTFRFTWRPAAGTKAARR